MWVICIEMVTVRFFSIVFLMVLLPQGIVVNCDSDNCDTSGNGEWEQKCSYICVFSQNAVFFLAEIAGKLYVSTLYKKPGIP